jgi:hypothetical protein
MNQKEVSYSVCSNRGCLLNFDDEREFTQTDLSEAVLEFRRCFRR